MTLTVAVLDNEALQAMAEPRHPKHRHLTSVLKAASHRGRSGRRSLLLVPTAVRVEAGVPRRWALDDNGIRDVSLDSARADRAALLVLQNHASAVDATVAEVALSQSGDVTVYTSDVSDLSRLLASSSVSVRRV